MIALPLSLLVALQVGAPVAEAPEPGTQTLLSQQDQAREHGLPGQRAGTERWIVHFARRGFDLEAFRKAVYAREDAETVAGIVRGLEAAVVEDQAAFVTFVDGLGGDVTDQWWIVNACAIEVDPARLDAVRKHPGVARVQPDLAYDPAGYAWIKNATNAQNHNADAVHALGYKGKGVTVAIMDTGVDIDMAGTQRPHKTLYLDGDTTKASRLQTAVTLTSIGPDDVHNHGTGCASVSAGAAWNTASSTDEGHAPEAGVASYCIALNTGGSSTTAVMTSAWQRIAADRTKFGIVAANNSYSGSPNPLDSTQQALDSAAYNADIMVAVAAGNNSSSTSSSQSCVNGLAVGAVNHTVKTMASFSSRGPLSGSGGRFYPDLSANGVSVVMALRDNEGSNYTASGTSFASPEVAGAATLFRSIATKATALETMTAILASTEDISKQNTSSPYNTRNAYGVGYLRDDRLADIALGKNGGAYGTVTVTPSALSQKAQVQVTANRWYSAVAAWHRHSTTTTSWSDYRLEAFEGTQSLSFIDVALNPYEKLVFRPTKTGTVDLVMTAKSLESGVTSQPVAWSVVEIPAPFVEGSFAAVGTGCPGSAPAPAIGTVVPSGRDTAFGDTRTAVILGYYPHRAQQIHLASSMPSTFVANGIAFRHDDAALNSINNYSIDFEVALGYTTVAPTAMSTAYASNLSEAATTVLAKKTVKLPYWTSTNTSVNSWLIQIPFDKPFVYQAQTGKHLILDTVRHAGSNGTGYAYYWIDAHYDSSVSRLYSTSPTATSGTRNLGLGAVVGFLSPSTLKATPVLSATGKPEIGTSFAARVDLAAAGTPTVFFVGASDQSWGPINLPLDLGGLGAPGCKLITGFEVLLGVSTASAAGTATLNVSVPNDKGLILGSLYLQGLLIDKPANAGGLVATNALRVLIGGQP